MFWLRDNDICILLKHIIHVHHLKCGYIFIKFKHLWMLMFTIYNYMSTLGDMYTPWYVIIFTLDYNIHLTKVHLLQPIYLLHIAVRLQGWLLPNKPWKDNEEIYRNWSIMIKVVKTPQNLVGVFPEVHNFRLVSHNFRPNCID